MQSIVKRRLEVFLFIWEVKYNIDTFLFPRALTLEKVWVLL